MMLPAASRLGRTFLAAAMMVAGCTVGPDFMTPETKVNAEWLATDAAFRKDSGAQNPDWWSALGSPMLDRLIETAYRNNPTLQVAAVRVLQAQAQLNISQGELFPQQQAISGSVDYQHADTGLRNSKTDFLASRIGVGASWEIDFWGKYRRGIESDEAQLSASVAAYHDALVTLTADVANAFVAARTLEAERAVLKSNAAAQRNALRIAEVRFKNGETSALDPSQASARLAETVARLPELDRQWHQAANTLSLLLGEPPGYADALLEASHDTPVAPKRIAVGLPSDLLRRRPDVREAMEAAAAQSALIGVAESLLYPSFSIGGFLGFGSNNFEPSSLRHVFTWQTRFVSASAGFVFPIFNYGRLVNQVRVEDAGFQQAILNYQNTVLSAQGDVENALASFTYGNQQTAALSSAAVSARRTTKLALDNYVNGQVDFTAVVAALDQQYKVEDALAQSKGAALSGLMSVYRALGGGWQVHGGKPVIDQGIATQMRARTNWGKMLPPTAPHPAKAKSSGEAAPDAG